MRACSNAAGEDTTTTQLACVKPGAVNLLPDRKYSTKSTGIMYDKEGNKRRKFYDTPSPPLNL